MITGYHQPVRFLSTKASLPNAYQMQNIMVGEPAYLSSATQHMENLVVNELCGSQYAVE